ncbi:VOC family protein [Rubritalea sp.]|uniref:VOC family protein n=1 Tax=Rubritalea sp. TaxID=2109375 RepID=UPI003EF6B6A3
MSENSNNCESGPGIISWNEITTNNKASSVAFYSKLFGWTTEDMELPDGQTYTTFKQGERVVAGCVVPPEGACDTAAWLHYVNVEDVDNSVVKAKELGATVIKERTDLPMGSFAIIQDPEGGVFAFWQPTGECPSQA